MKREIVVGVAGLAIAAAACAGCSSNKSNPGASSSSAAAPAGPQLTVDGQNQNISGAVTCNTANGVLTIGVGDATAGIGAVLSTDNPPIVHSVGSGQRQRCRARLF